MTALYEYLPVLLRASLSTLALAIGGLAVATVLGALGAAGRLSGGRIGREITWIYTTIIRGIPDIVLLLIIYYGLQRIVNRSFMAIGLEPFDISPFWAGVLALGFIYGAYLTETFRGAYRSVPAGQSEAAASLGLHRFTTLRYVVFPQLVRYALPGYANTWQVLVKSTAVISIIGFEDIVGLANKAGKTTREPFLFLVFVLCVYLFYTWITGLFFAWLERRYAEKGVRA